jgi:hypothetical protein
MGLWYEIRPLRAKDWRHSFVNNLKELHALVRGRVYAASRTLFDSHNVTVIFAGYHTQKPKNGLGDYRTIGRVSLHSSREIVALGQGGATTTIMTKSRSFVSSALTYCIRTGTQG